MKLTLEEAKKLNILDVATSLGMDMIKTTRNEYYWTEHDSLKINVQKNMFRWYSKDLGGDTIKLVQTIKAVPFKEAMNFLETGEFKVAEEIREEKKEPFKYFLGKYETDFENGREYLKNVRGLSDETIDYFLREKVLSLVNRKTKDGYEEQVIVFKYLDENKNIIGGSMQGIVPNKERYEGKGYLKQIMYNSEGNAGFNVSIGDNIEKLIFFEAPIDMMSYYELNKEKLENTKLIAMDGLKEVTISRYFLEHIITNPESRDTLDLKHSIDYLDYVIKNTTYFEEEKNFKAITLAVDNDSAGAKFISKLQEKGMKFEIDRPNIKGQEEKVDWNNVLIKEKELSKVDKIDNKKSLEENQGVKNVENTIGDFTDKSQQAAPLPEENKSQPLNDLSPNQTGSQRLLNFSIANPQKSINKQHYHAIKNNELKRLNRYSVQLQQVAKWYLEELADTKIHYMYKDNDNINKIEIDFKKEHFMHLTGIFPLKENQTSEQTLLDFVNGRGNYDNILISDGGSTFQKLQVLPEIEEILNSTSFYFNDLSSVEKLNKLDLSKAIIPKDKDLLLLFREQEENLIPASLMRIKGGLSKKLDNVKEKEILGIYREKNGKLEQLSINEKYISDGGRELMNILEKNNEEEINTIERNVENNIRYDRPNIENVTQEKTINDYIKNKDVDGLNTLLKEGIKEYTNSETYKKYLDTVRKFTKYSRRNIDLIYKQNKNATYIAGYNAWKNKFGRQVKKGEKGLTIISPRVIEKKDADGNPILDEKGEPQTTILFGKTTVFDVSQTEGKELPQAIYDIEKEVDGYFNIYKAVKQYAKEDKIEIDFAELPKEIKGAYNPKENKILLKKGMSKGHTIKTLFHELAHAKVHKGIDVDRGSVEYNLQELEAESIAYIISGHYGLDTSEYTFGYLYGYMQDRKDYTDLDNVIGNIHLKSKELIEKIDITLEKIKSQELNKDTLQSKIERTTKKQAEKMEQKNREVTEEKKQNTMQQMKQT